MQVRWNYKLKPNTEQDARMAEWLVTLRKHRNYCLRERENGWNDNNRTNDEPIVYAYGSYCDIETNNEWGSCSPLTCPVVRHGVMSAELTKISKDVLKWGNASDIQMKRTTQLRHESAYYSRVDSDVLQRNIAKLDDAFQGFWKNGRGFPKYAIFATFKSFEYKPKRCKFAECCRGKLPPTNLLEVNRIPTIKHRYSHVYLPLIGWVKYFDSRPIPEDAETRTVTITRKSDGWYMSVLLNLTEVFPLVTPLAKVKSIVGIDVGINRLVALLDGSFVENPKLGTNQRVRRRLRLRQRRVNRKQKGSKNRSKSGKVVARLHQKIVTKRDAHQWQATKKIVQTADAIAHEALNILGMKKRCKPKKANGRFMKVVPGGKLPPWTHRPNGQSAKRGLNRSISDAAWGELFQKIVWLALKTGKPVVRYNPRNTSRECSECRHISQDNRNGEKFICENCGHIDHADTQAARTGLKRVGLKFVSTRHKNLPRDSRKVTTVSYDPASNGKRDQGSNLESMASNVIAMVRKQDIRGASS